MSDEDVALQGEEEYESGSTTPTIKRKSKKMLSDREQLEQEMQEMQEERSWERKFAQYEMQICR